MATAITRYVDTASSGGDGTTPNLSGATAAFASLAAAATAIGTYNFVSADEIWTINCKATSGAADTSTATFGILTDDATRYLTIICNEDHGGKWNTSIYRIESNLPLSIQGAHYTRIIGIQASMNKSTANSNPGIYLISSTARIHRCIVRSQYTGGAGSGIPIAIFASGGGSVTLELSDSIIYDWSQADEYGSCSGFQAYYHDNVYVTNNTVINCRRGIRGGDDTSSHRLFNNLVQCDSENGTFTDYTDSFHTDSSHNLSSDGTAPGSNVVINTTLTFVDKANDNFHLAASDSAAINAGVDKSAAVSATLLSINDCDNVARSGSWDIGADEYVASVATGYKNLLLLGVG